MHSSFQPGKGGATAHYHAVEDGPSAPRRRGCFQGWWWEMTAAAATLGCMAAVVYILFRMQDRPAADWTFPITLNSTIAAFVTAAKSTALLILASCVGQSKWLHFQQRPSRLQDLDTFDEASRGPSGALKLLWRLRARFGSAVVAALVTVVALGVDSFAQQVVKLDQRTEMVESANATFWVTDTYNGGALHRDQTTRYYVEGNIPMSYLYHKPIAALTYPSQHPLSIRACKVPFTEAFTTFPRLRPSTARRNANGTTATSLSASSATAPM